MLVIPLQRKFSRWCRNSICSYVQENGVSSEFMVGVNMLVMNLVVSELRKVNIARVFLKNRQLL